MVKKCELWKQINFRRWCGGGLIATTLKRCVQDCSRPRPPPGRDAEMESSVGAGGSETARAIRRTNNFLSSALVCAWIVRIVVRLGWSQSSFYPEQPWLWGYESQIVPWSLKKKVTDVNKSVRILKWENPDFDILRICYPYVQERHLISISHRVIEFIFWSCEFRWMLWRRFDT